jgi:hypothetical protein
MIYRLNEVVSLKLSNHIINDTINKENSYNKFNQNNVVKASVYVVIHSKNAFCERE